MRLIIVTTLLFLFAVNTMLYAETSDQEKKETKKLKYDVRIQARILPLFVVDLKGNPVFGLKKSDFRLYVNKKEREIGDLLSYRFRSVHKGQKEVLEEKRIKRRKKPSRVVFVIFDSIFNSRFGFKRMKTLACRIIESGSDNDRFILLGIHHRKGLYTIAGPMSDKKILIDTINKKQFFSPVEYEFMGIKSDLERIGREGEDKYDELLKKMRKQQKEQESEQYAYAFLQSLDRLKNVTSLIKKPKVVYLFSQGILNNILFTYGLRDGVAPIAQKIELKHYKGPMVAKLINTLELLNSSGASMFFINPGKVESEFGEFASKLSLKIIARETGGEFFEGSRVKKIIDTVTKRTDAYYELIHYGSATGSKNRTEKIKIVPKDSSLIVYSPRSSVVEKAYGQMSEFEKKLYAVGLVEGNVWGDVSGDIIHKRFNAPDKINLISVDIPEGLRNMYGDFYIVRMSKSDREPGIIKFSRNISENETLRIDREADEKLYYVIISAHSRKVIVGREGN